MFLLQERRLQIRWVFCYVPYQFNWIADRSEIVSHAYKNNPTGPLLRFISLHSLSLRRSRLGRTSRIMHSRKFLISVRWLKLI